MEAPELIRLAMKRQGVAGPTELADTLGLPGRHTPQKISRWLKGQNEPDYQATLALLEAAGLLARKAAPPAEATGSETDPATMREFAAIQAAQTEAVELLVVELRALRAEVTRALPPPAEAPRGRAKRST